MLAKNIFNKILSTPEHISYLNNIQKHSIDGKNDQYVSNIRPQTHLTYTKHNRQSEEHHKILNAHHYSLEEIQGNTTKHIHCHHQNNTRIRKHYMVTNYIVLPYSHKHKQTTNRTKYSAAHPPRTHARHEHATSP